jgi:disulfide oxidoreductase YuzD
MWLMVTPVRVTIVGAPVACGTEVKDTWRELATWIAGELRRRYGDAVEVDYHDLFDPDSPSLPAGTHLPLVLLDGRVLSSGGKLSVPVIRKALEGAGVAPVLARSSGAA